MDYLMMAMLNSRRLLLCRDNSYNSHNSRYFGPVSKEAVIKPFFIYYPFTKRWGLPDRPAILNQKVLIYF